MPLKSIFLSNLWLIFAKKLFFVLPKLKSLFMGINRCISWHTNRFPFKGKAKHEVNVIQIEREKNDKRCVCCVVKKYLKRRRASRNWLRSASYFFPYLLSVTTVCVFSRLTLLLFFGRKYFSSIWRRRNTTLPFEEWVSCLFEW